MTAFRKSVTHLGHVVDELVSEAALVVADPAEEPAEAVLAAVVVGDDPARVPLQPLLADVALDHVRLAVHVGVRLLHLAATATRTPRPTLLSLRLDSLLKYELVHRLSLD